MSVVRKLKLENDCIVIVPNCKHFIIKIEKKNFTRFFVRFLLLKDMNHGSGS